VLAEEWPRFWTQAIKDLCVPVDKSTSDASRLYFLPARPEGASYRLEVHEGEPIDVDAVLARAPHKVERTSVANDYEGGTIAEGNRDNTLLRFAGAMRRNGLEVPEIRAALEVMNQTRVDPPVEPEDLDRISNSVGRYDKEDDQQSLEEFSAYFREKESPEVPRQGYVISLTDFYERHDANVDDKAKWLIEGIVGKGVPQIMAGPPKSQKSWIMYSKALAIASGMPWLGRYEVERGRVLIISREDDENEAHRRIVRLAVDMGIDLRSLEGWLSINALDPFSFNGEGYVHTLEDTIDQWDPAFIQMDCLARVHAGDENSSKDMNLVTRVWADMCKRYGVAIELLHHYNKGDAGTMLNRMRGTSDLGAVVRHATGVCKLDIEDPGFDGAISMLEFEGNLPGVAESFSVGVSDRMVGENKAVSITYRSAAKTEAFNQCKRDILAFLAISEPDPQSKTAVLGCCKASPTVKVAVLNQLLEDGEVEMMNKKYRIGDPA
jgi:hypothetical protein